MVKMKFKKDDGKSRFSKRTTAFIIGGSILFVVIVIASIVAAVIFSTTVVFTVDGKKYRVRNGTQISTIALRHHNFGKKKGNLISVSGELLQKEEGNAPWATLDGRKIDDIDSTSDRVWGDQTMKVYNGTNRTEPHTVIMEEIPYPIMFHSGGVISFIKQRGTPGKREIIVGDISHQRVEGKVVVEPVTAIVESFTPHPSHGKYAALTFDDGPSIFTPQILSILQKYHVHATFFNVGKEAQRYPQYERELIKEGDELASHSYSHPDLLTLSPQQQREQLIKTADIFKANLHMNHDVTMLRPPYGAINVSVWRNAGMALTTSVLWNIDTEDWREPGAAVIAQNATKNVVNGSVILMHDGGGNRSETVAALPQIIETLQKQGFKLVTISELMRTDGRFPQNVINSGYYFPLS